MNFIVIAANLSNLGQWQIAGCHSKLRAIDTHENQILLKGNAKLFFVDHLKIGFADV